MAMIGAKHQPRWLAQAYATITIILLVSLCARAILSFSVSFHTVNMTVVPFLFFFFTFFTFFFFWVVQVMAEAADLCAHTLVHHCRSPRLLKPIADALCTDRNAKLRHFCAKYMLQVRQLQQVLQPSCVSVELLEVTQDF